MHFWRKDPEQWRKMSAADRAEMMAYATVRRAIDGYQSDWFDSRKPKTPQK